MLEILNLEGFRVNACDPQFIRKERKELSQKEI